MSVSEISGIFFTLLRIKKHCLFCKKKNPFFFPKIVAFRRQITSFLFLPKMSTSIFWTKLSTIDQKKMTIHLQKFTASDKKKHVIFYKTVVPSQNKNRYSLEGLRDCLTNFPKNTAPILHDF